MKVHTYLNYGGNCEEAFQFYEKHLGGKILRLMKQKDCPPSMTPMPGMETMVMHAQLQLGDTVLMGSDAPRYEPMRSAYISLSLDSSEEAERVQAALAEGGEVFMPMQETFWAHRFSMLRDRFGTNWMVQHERAQH